jgi:hypothetical protein
MGDGVGDRLLYDGPSSELRSFRGTSDEGMGRLPSISTPV